MDRQLYVDIAVKATELPSTAAYWSFDAEVTYDDGSVAVCRAFTVLKATQVGPGIAACPAVPDVQGNCGPVAMGLRLTSRTFDSPSMGEAVCETMGFAGPGASIEVPVSCPGCPSPPTQATACDYPSQLQCPYTAFDHFHDAYTEAPCRCTVGNQAVERRWFCTVF